MCVAVRSFERVPAACADRTEDSVNQRRMDEAFRMLGILVARVVNDPNPSLYLLDLASQGGVLQAVWCRDGSSGFIPTVSETDPSAITDGMFGPVNAERYQRAQKALSTLLLELTHPDCDGSATLKVRGLGGELADDIRGESHRRWRF
jgi:hypothetical protein